MINWIEVLGIIAGVCTTISVIPQIRKLMQTKSAKDISYMMYILNCAGFILWIIYGAVIESIALVLANLVTLGLQSSVLVMKYKWEKNES